MNITFVAIGWEQLSVSLLSAIAKKEGHTVKLAFSVALFNDRRTPLFGSSTLANVFNDKKLVMQEIVHQKPDALVFSTLTSNYRWMLEIAQQTKELFPRCKTIFGGIHVSAVPENVIRNPQVDYICIGEGDLAFPKILQSIENDKFEPIPNTWFKTTNRKIIRGQQSVFIQDLDILPIFDKTLWEDHISIKDFYMTMASRGCPYRCTFCFNNYFANLGKGNFVRQRSVEHMLYELRLAKKRYNIRKVEFFDDIFTLNKSWLKAFLDGYRKEINIPFQCTTHVNFMDDQTARWLSDAGCFATQIGVQSIDERYKRQEIKRYEKNTNIEKSIQLCRKYKMQSKVDHIFDLPGENIEIQELARQFYVKNAPYKIKTYLTDYFPGTELIGQAQKLGILSKKDIDIINEGHSYHFLRKHKRNKTLHTKIYLIYALIFKLIPILPNFLRKRLKPELFIKLPYPAVQSLNCLAEALTGLFRLELEHVSYFKHYVHHIFRLIMIKLKLKAPSLHTSRKTPSSSLHYQREITQSSFKS